MKHSSFLLSNLARLLCTAVVLGLLAGCSAAASTTSSSSVEAAVTPSQAQVQSTSAPSAAVSDATNGIALQPLTLPNDALDQCLGWGPGTAGSTLHSVSAAVAALNWATENELSAREAQDVTECLQNWYNALSAFDQETLGETWDMVCEDAATLLTDPTALAGSLESAGLSVASVTYASAEDWAVLCDVMSTLVVSAN